MKIASVTIYKGMEVMELQTTRVAAVLVIEAVFIYRDCSGGWILFKEVGCVPRVETVMGTGECSSKAGL